MNSLKRLLIISLSLAFLIGIHSTAQAGFSVPTIAEYAGLIPNGPSSIQAGDKVFDNWSVNETLDNYQFIAGHIAVNALDDGDLDPGPGLHYDVFNGLYLSQVDDTSQEISFEFSYRVTTSGELLIKDNSLLNLLGGVGNIAGDDENFGYEIWEYVYDADPASATTELLGTKHVYDYNDEDGWNNIAPNDSISFAPIDEIWVTTSLRVWTSLASQSAWIEAFDQRFSQTASPETPPVPEPATMLLLGTGLVGVAGAARRRKKK